MRLTDCGSIEYKSDNEVKWLIDKNVDQTARAIISPKFFIVKDIIKLNIALVFDNKDARSERDCPFGPNNFEVQLMMSSNGSKTIKEVEMSLCSTYYTNYEKQQMENFYPLSPVVFTTFKLFKDENLRPLNFRSRLSKQPESVIQIFYKDIKIVCEIVYNMSFIDEDEKLFNNVKFSDLTLVVSNKEFKVHKVILSIHSDVFAAIINDNAKKSEESKIIINDVNVDVMKEILRFIYNGRVRNIEKMAFDLIPPAEKYGFDDLVMYCEKNLMYYLSSENVKQILILLDCYELNLLRKKTIEFITDKDNWRTLKTKDFLDCLRNLSKDLIIDLIASL